MTARAVAVLAATFATMLAAALGLGCTQHDRPPLVLAAASLAGPLGELVGAVEPQGRLSFSASGTAARQIAAGAPADLLVLADAAWLAVAGGRLGPPVAFAGNQLVVVAPLDSSLVLALDGSPPVVESLALGDPSFVPAGRYAEEALRALGWWEALESQVIPATDVRMALRLVASGEAQLGVVYASDALASDRVRVLAELPESLHRPIRYVAAVVDASARGQRLLDALCGPSGAAVLERHGLRPILVDHAEP